MTSQTHALLSTELTSLASEVKRKHPEIRQAAEQVLARLKSNPESTINACKDEAVPAEENLLLKPVLEACNTKIVKAQSLALSILQRLVSIQAVPTSAVPAIIQTLSQIAPKADVDVQLKTLQVTAALLSSYQSIHDKLLSSTLLLCFRLQDSRVSVVSSTAAATLRQAVMTIFEKVAAEDVVLDGIKDGGEDAAAAAPLAAMSVPIPDSEHGSVTLFPCSKDAYLTITDLNSLASGEPASFLQLNSLPRTFALELIESILTNHSNLFRSSHHPELLLVLRQYTCPLLIKALSEKPVFPTSLRLMRVLFLLLRQFSAELILEVEILMNIMIKTIQPLSHAGGIPEERDDGGLVTPPWQRILVMEVIRSLTADMTFLRNLWKWYDASSSGSSVFAKLIESLHRLVTENPAALGRGSEQMSGSAAATLSRRQSSRGSIDQGYAGGLYEAAAGIANAAIGGVLAPNTTEGVGLSFEASAPSMQTIDQLDKAEAPGTPPTYVYLLAMQSLVNIAQAFSSYVLPAYSAYVNARPKNSSRAPPPLDLSTLSGSAKSDMEAGVAMVKSAWTSLLASFTFLISSKCDDAVFAEVLSALRNFTNVTGVLSLQTPRDAFLASLLKFAVPRPVVAAVAAYKMGMGPAGGAGGAGGGAGGDSNAANVNAQRPRLLTRNLACLKALTQISHYLSGILHERWLEVLEGLCDAEFVLQRTMTRNNKLQSAEDSPPPPPSRSLIGSTFQNTTLSSVDPRTGQPQLLSDLDADSLLAGIRHIFENSIALDTDAFVAFVKALCQLSDQYAHIDEAVAGGGQSPASSPTKARSGVSSGSVASAVRLTGSDLSFPLSNIGLVFKLNIERLCGNDADKGWNTMVDHILKLIQGSLLRAALRLQASDVLDSSLLLALNTANDQRVKVVQRQVLDALQVQSILDRRRANAADVEVRKRGLEALLKAIESHGHGLLLGWETIFEISSAACPVSPAAEAAASSQETPSNASSLRSSAPLIKVAFSSLQLVCSDLLSLLSHDQVRLCISTLTDFSLQHEEVNVALTANGTLWIVTAELASRWSKAEVAKAEKDVGSLTELWLFLLHCILRVAADKRSDVRNGAIATLFRVLQQYGDSFKPDVWQRATWEVIFPLLASLDATVKANADRGLAVTSPGQESRRLSSAVPPSATSDASNTLRLWEDSHILALQNLGRTLGDNWQRKYLQAEYGPIWDHTLKHLETVFVRGPSHVAEAAIRGLQYILENNTTAIDTSLSESVSETFKKGWAAWISVGTAISTSSNNVGKRSHPMTQGNLVTVVKIFTPLYKVLDPWLTIDRLEAALNQFKDCILYDQSPDYPPDVDNLSPLQSSVLETIRGMKIVDGLPSFILTDLAQYASLAFSTAAMPQKSARNQPTYVALFKASAAEIKDNYSSWQDRAEIYEFGALLKVFAGLRLPMQLKYDCPAPSRAAGKGQPLWKTATLVFCHTASLCCRQLQKLEDRIDKEKVQGTWRQLLGALEGALTADCGSLEAESDRKLIEQDEVFDLILLSTFEKSILPFLGLPQVPSELIVNFSRVLSQATSLYTPVTLSHGADGTPNVTNSAAARKGGAGHRKQQSSGKQQGNGAAFRGNGYGTTADIIPTSRLHFAYWAFDLLFLMCSNVIRDDKEGPRRRVARLALPALMKRCSTVLSSYCEDSYLRGPIPASRIRDEELNYVLASLLDLHLWPDTMLDPDEQVSAGSKTDVRALTERTDPSDRDIGAVIQQLSRRSSRGHLFELHSLLCDVVFLPSNSAVAPISPATIGTSTVLSVKVELPAIGTETQTLGLVGQSNPLGSARLDRSGLQRAPELARQALSVISNIVAPRSC
ncbi:Endocytosis and vacuole integrity protein [Tilletia horrida]|nr:Endocytosis and vacuole integrity protein [Tilletia horrida]